MSDYIDRQAAIDALAKHEKSKGHNYTLFVDIVSECAEIIRDLPSAEVEPVKRGKWIYDNQFHWYRASCSKCGYKRVTDIKAEKWNDWHYCPHCGARMEPIPASSENGQEVSE